MMAFEGLADRLQRRCKKFAEKEKYLKQMLKK